MGVSLLAGALQADDTLSLMAPARPDELHVEWADGSLGVTATAASLAAVLEAVAVAANLELDIEGRLDELSTVEFERLSLREAIERLLDNRSFLLRPAARAPDESRGLLMVFARDQPAKSAPVALAESHSVETQELEHWLAALDSEDAPARLRAIAMLAEFDSELATEAIAHAALFDSQVAVREEAVNGLAEIGSDSARRVLEQSLLDPDPQLREAALDAFSHFSDEDAAWSLAFMLADEDPELRVEAVYALGEIGGEAARTLLQGALSDHDGEVVEAATEALEDLSGEG